MGRGAHQPTGGGLVWVGGLARGRGAGHGAHQPTGGRLVVRRDELAVDDVDLLRAVDGDGALGARLKRRLREAVVRDAQRLVATLLQQVGVVLPLAREATDLLKNFKVPRTYTNAAETERKTHATDAAIVIQNQLS